MPDAGSKLQDKVHDAAKSTMQKKLAEHAKESLKLQQEINKYQAIPRSSTGQTENLGNAPTPEPLEPTVCEPGNVYYQNPEPKAEEAKP